MGNKLILSFWRELAQEADPPSPEILLTPGFKFNSPETFTFEGSGESLLHGVTAGDGSTPQHCAFGGLQFRLAS